MSEMISTLVVWLNAHPQLAGLVTFLISAAESVAIIGTIVPGTIMMTAIGALAGAGVIPLWETIIWAILGAILGDGISYWIGYYFKGRLPYLWPFKNHPILLATGEKFFHKYGSMSVFIGRFVGPVRALVPLVAGMLGMRPLQFTIANVTSAIGWAPIYMLPGILLGAASLELPPDIALNVILVLLLFILFTLLCLWFIYKTLQLIHQQTNNLQNEIWQKLKHSRYFSISTIVLKHHDSSKTHGQLTLAFYSVMVCLALISLSIIVKCFGPATLTVNDTLFHLFRGLRALSIDHFMIALTLLGQKQAIWPVISVIVMYLLYFDRQRAAWHLLALGVLASSSVYCIKHLLKIPRPWGIIQNLGPSYSMPSGHTTLATALFMFLAFLLASSCRSERRFYIYSMSLIISFLVGLSRIYLGAHWFTDVLAGWLLSALLLMLIILSYTRQYEKPLPPHKLFTTSVLTLLVSVSIYFSLSMNHLHKGYTLVDWPIVNINMKKWWASGEFIPNYRASVFGFPSQRINIEWVGDLEHIKNDLMKAGWMKPPARNWISTLHRIADISSNEYLPMVSPQYLNKAPTLILSRSYDNKGLLVLRLWSANRTIKTNHPVWVGIVGIIPRSYSWIFKHQHVDVDVSHSILFPHSFPHKKWHDKLVKLHENDSQPPRIQKILLIRDAKLH